VPVARESTRYTGFTLQSCKLSNSRAKPCQNVTPWCYGSLWLIQPILFLPVRGLLSMTSTTHCVRPGCPGQEIAGNENPPQFWRTSVSRHACLSRWWCSAGLPCCAIRFGTGGVRIRQILLLSGSGAGCLAAQGEPARRYRDHVGQLSVSAAGCAGTELAGSHGDGLRGRGRPVSRPRTSESNSKLRSTSARPRWRWR